MCAHVLKRAVKGRYPSGICAADLLNMKRVFTPVRWVGRAAHRVGAVCTSVGKRLASPAAVPVSAVPRIVVGASDSIEHVLDKLHETAGAVSLMLDNGQPVGMVTERHLDEYLERRDAA